MQLREWFRVLPRTYRLAAFPTSWKQFLMAVFLWAGEAAVVSYRSAASLHGFVQIPERFFELTVPYSRHVPDPKIQLHVTNRFLPGDIARIGPLSVTSVTRTLIDVSSVLDIDQLEVLLEDALRRRLVTVERLESRIEKLQELGRRGAGRLSELLNARSPSARPTDTDFETKAIQMLRRAGLPSPVRQFWIGETRVDLAYPERCIAIECDSRTFHSQPKDEAKDALRNNGLIALRWQLFTITWDDLKKANPLVVQQIATAYYANKGAMRP